MKSSILANLFPETFLKEYWQKKPLLIRQAFPDFQPMIEADELAGLALEEEVESRLVIKRGETPWQLKRGPFKEEEFANLPPTHWTLLVQGMNHWVPEINSVLDHFDFLPSWRVDDIMVSYASAGGSVGPHYDQYDVFLIQSEGRRRWQVGPVYDENSSRIGDIDLHILSEFEVLEEFALEPGDMLYIPPGVGHNGVAEGECMTMSVGFRAPSHREILMQYTDFLSDKLPDSLRYSDPNLTLPKHKGEIDEVALDRLQSILKEHIDNRQLLGQWFGELVTELKHEQPVDESFADWSSLVSEAEGLSSDSEGLSLLVNEGSRFAYRDQGSSRLLFADGHSFSCLSDETCLLALSLCSESYLGQDAWLGLETTESQTLVLALINSGSLYLSE